MKEITYGHSPLAKMFDQPDVYAIGFDEERAGRSKIRLGLIGVGGVAQSKHLPAVMRLKTMWEPVEIAAICDPSVQQSRKVADLYHCASYEDYQTMLRAEKLDGVLVLSPDTLHYEHTMASLEAGVHVLVEKPISRSLAEAAQMCNYASERGLVLMTVSNKRFSPPYRMAKRFVDSGPVCNPGLFSGKFNLGYDYVDLFEGGTIHLFDLARYLMGDAVKVHAIGVKQYNLNKTGYPFDHAAISLTFRSGAIGTLYSISSALSLKPWERVEVYGEKSWLTVEDQRQLILYDSESGPAKVWDAVMPNTLLFDEEFGGYMGMLENFLQSIRGVEEPLVTGWDGFHAFELAVASHLSIKAGEPVSLPLDPRKEEISLRGTVL